MKIGVVDLPGSNSSSQVIEVLKKLGQEPVRLSYRDEGLQGATAIVIPGGFSFGDYLRPGALAKGTPVMGIIRRFSQDGGPVLGIGNGFQILCETEVLPGCLLQNPDMKFCGKQVRVKVESNKCPFTRNIPAGTILSLPLGCYCGRYYTDKRTINDLENTNHVALRYCDEFGEVNKAAPMLDSINSTAAIINRHENVMGMMPRAELAVDELFGSTDGLAFFQSLIA